MLRRAGAFAMLLLATVGAYALPPAERIRFGSLDGEDGKPVSIDGLLFRPAGAPATRPLPAVIALHGCGSTTLATINAGNRDVASFRARAEAPFFRAAVAFYPGCSPASRDAQWRPAVATRILIGAADDWTPAAACEALGARARRHAWPLEVIVYANAHHGFDAPRGKLVHRADVPNGVSPGQGVHAGPDPAAREDAHRRVAAFLRESLAH